MRPDFSFLLGKNTALETGKFLAAWAVSDETPEVYELPLGGAFPSPPRGAITEISGALSSGRTTLAYAILAHATAAGEFCAFVDGAGAFDPRSAAEAGVDLPHLLWVRANGRLEAAFKAADLILHGGGFGVIVLDLCEASTRDLNRIPLSYWYRFRGAVENTPGKLVVVSHAPLAKSCARLRLEALREAALWQGSTPVFSGIQFAIHNRKQRAQRAG
jgi:hypothetical protein